MTPDKALTLAQGFAALCAFVASASYVACAIHYVVTERKRAAMLARLAENERKRQWR